MQMMRTNEHLLLTLLDYHNVANNIQSNCKLTVMMNVLAERVLSC